jgi:putative FmdB family regulatory protein
MPTYEYFCKNCGAEFEQFQSIRAESLKICPECGQATLERKISGGSGLIFKGSGFYITDYKGKKDISAESSAKTTPAVKKNPAKPVTKTSTAPVKETTPK